MGRIELIEGYADVFYACLYGKHPNIYLLIAVLKVFVSLIINRSSADVSSQWLKTRPSCSRISDSRACAMKSLFLRASSRVTAVVESVAVAGVQAS